MSKTQNNLPCKQCNASSLYDCTCEEAVSNPSAERVSYLKQRMRDTKKKEMLIAISSCWIEYAGDINNYHSFIRDVEEEIDKLNNEG